MWGIILIKMESNKRKQIREIKFRAWDKENKSFIHSFDLYFLKYNLDNILVQGFGEKIKIILMQFTGLKDKNGKEIFEGDIVKLNEHYDYDSLIPEHIVIVKFLEGSWALVHKEIRGTVGYIDELHSNVINDRIEVIGNIYENPELLEKIRK